ncbi:hypothetical protein BS50DRAFT_269058 [Corynespora cassiicola Philippines]|uniref:Uncharacterized protein n=1 Tax=Corynespora cassiicola Philippines TaxID=1448308 RepID=A0A2T2NZM9_CORCC|nr:hypothetical protein BS50DRAFT_269058 [Corynespora cassiicola Philippines]
MLFVACMSWTGVVDGAVEASFTLCADVKPSSRPDVIWQASFDVPGYMNINVGVSMYSPPYLADFRRPNVPLLDECCGSVLTCGLGRQKQGPMKARVCTTPEGAQVLWPGSRVVDS